MQPFLKKLTLGSFSKVINYLQHLINPLGKKILSRFNIVSYVKGENKIPKPYSLQENNKVLERGHLELYSLSKVTAFL